MKYYIYWSVLDAPTNSLKTDHVLLFFSILFLIFWVLVLKFKKNNNDLEKPIILWCIGLFAAMIFSMFIYVEVFTKDDTEERVNKYLDSSQVAKVEGKITNFTRNFRHLKYGTIISECFQVDSVKFGYDNNTLARFNGFGKVNNGVLYNEVNVRITYSRGDFNQIKKIEISK